MHTGSAISALHVDAQNVYWLDGTSVMRCPLTGCASSELFATCTSGRLAGTADAIYCEGSGSVLRIPK